ncbi:hypothetical protein B9Z55_028067 [Caenorhabditis nigoni]|uniref:Lin-66-like winged helix domain-containing protein n=2 Tax=Caenorhabditis nigoni TaxID=1611254 RepID=A0A2G5SD24_9PELO|nr:hypothetical protein B9Z55_028067 [Caenorhabditis nigoni]
MARELNGLYLSNPSMDSQQHQRAFSLHDFPPISVPANFAAPSLFDTARGGALNYQNNYNGYAGQGGYYGGPAMQAPTAIEVQHSVKGYGLLTWLSSKAGVITNANKTTVSFQLKEFCDQGVNDLTQVLRVGFTLKYHALKADGEQYTATQVSPVFGAEADEIFDNAPEIDLQSKNPTPVNAKESYAPDLEFCAYGALLGTFQRQGTHKLQLSNLHSHISNQGDEKLFRYVGSSSMKRRNFIERRTHVFHLTNDDSIYLQHPAIYQAVYLLSTYLLRRGGVVSIQSLFDYFNSDSVEKSVRDCIGYDNGSFLNLLSSHNFAFAVFPNRTYVSARRNLPNYDYPGFINQFFPSIFGMTNRSSYEHQQIPRGIQRTMSVPMGDGYGMGRQHNGYMHRRPAHPWGNQYSQPNGTRPMSLMDSHLVSPHLEDHWNTGSNMGLWSNGGLNTIHSSRVGSPGGDSYSDHTVTNELGNLKHLRLNTTKASTGTQVGKSVIGQMACVCHCKCGRGSIGPIGTSLAALPEISPEVNNLGFMGNRPLSISTASSEETQLPTTDSYNLFSGPNDFLSGSMDSLRLSIFN